MFGNVWIQKNDVISNIESNYKEQSLESSRDNIYVENLEDESSSSESSDVEDRIAKMQEIFKNKESIFIRKVK